MFQFFFFFNDTATTEIYTLSLHDALPISVCRSLAAGLGASGEKSGLGGRRRMDLESGESAFSDRKSTRLNSSHPSISYAVFCLKKKKRHNYPMQPFFISSVTSLIRQNQDD